MIYDDYLKLSKILSAQNPVSLSSNNPIHDEMFFIIVHQTHELWFKQILHEIEYIIPKFKDLKINITEITSKLHRIISVFELLISSIGIIETLSPLDFLEFRKLLTPASGMHSNQFKLLMYKIGLPPQHRVEIDKIHEGLTLFNVVDLWLAKLFDKITNDDFFNKTYINSLEIWCAEEKKCIKKNTFLDESQKSIYIKKINEHFDYCKEFLNAKIYSQLILSNKRTMSFNASRTALFVFLHQENSQYHHYFNFLSALKKIDNLVISWQITHAQMAKNMIGNKIGTSGTYNAEQLMHWEKTAFSDLQDLITLLIPKSALLNPVQY